MTPGSVLVLAGIEPVPGPESALAARLCAAISQMAPRPPVRIVAQGDLALLLPAVALSQRSVHRAVESYVLIDPVLPAVTDSWPDARVTVVTDDEWILTQARLRGWEIAEPGDVPALLEPLD